MACMFWFTKSKAKHDKIKTQDLQILVNYNCEEKFYLWTYDITFSGYLSWWGLCLHFLKKSSITYYIQYYDSDLSLATLTTLFCKATHKNTFFSDYFDYADLHEIVSSLITLTTLMFKVTWKIVPSLNSLTSLFSIPG